MLKNSKKHINKPLSQMSLEELWKLFPIILTKPNKTWIKWYNKEKKKLDSILPIKNIIINHIGSTAIKNIYAKPIIDILIEIPSSISLEYIKQILIKNNYICMSQQINRISFNKGYTQNGFAKKVFHIHLRYHNDNDELYFRDYMNTNPLLAKKYEELKLLLLKKYKYNRDAYTLEKTDFVVKQTNAAKKYYNLKYNS